MFRVAFASELSRLPAAIFFILWHWETDKAGNNLKVGAENGNERGKGLNSREPLNSCVTIRP